MVAANTWTSQSNNPSSVSQAQLTFITTQPIPNGGYIILELPDSGWSMPPIPQILFKNPSGAASAVWDGTNDRLTIKASATIAADDIVITVGNVRAPSGVVHSTTASVVTRDAVATVINGPFTIQVVDIVQGQLSGALYLKPEVNVRDTISGLSFFFTCMSTIPTGGFITLELPAGWSCDVDTPSVTFTHDQGVIGTGNWSETKNTLTVHIDSKDLEAGTEVAALVDSMLTPPASRPAETATIATWDSQGRAVDGLTR